MQGTKQKYISVRELAQRWGISEKAIYDWRSAGRALPRAIRIGGRLRFDLTDVERFEQTQEVCDA